MQQHHTEETEPTAQKPAAPASLSPAAQELLQTPVAERQERAQMLAHLKRLRKRNPLRKLFDTDGNLRNRLEETFSLLLRTLQSDNEGHWRSKIVAAGGLRQLDLTEEQIAVAVPTLCNECDGKHLRQAWRIFQRTGRTLMRAAWLSYSLGFLFACFGWYVSLIYELFVDTFLFLFFFLMWGTLLLFPCALLFAPFSFSCDMSRMRNVRLTAIRTLEHFALSYSTGTLARAACESGYDIRQAANQALIAVLPTLTPEHYGQIGSDVVPNLCRILDNRRKEDNQVPVEDAVALAILGALEKVGDGRAIATVQRLAERGLGKRQAEAARILPILQERQRQEQNHSMLLRGAACPETPPEHLLRPAEEERSAPPEQLLRAASADAETLP